MNLFKNKKILIFGLGIQGGGVGAAEFFCQQGAKVRVTDLKEEKDLKPSLRKLEKYKIEYTLGKHKKEDFCWADLVIRNPDVPLNSSFLQFCFQNKIPVEMEESLFMKLCPVPVIGVTGTRGKSTTTVLISEILKEAGYRILLGGNLRGVATLLLLEELESSNQKTKVILELSSWQLQGFGWDKISPNIAVVTNIYPDHLNRYSSMEDYVNDKKNIFKFQKEDDYLLLNRENEITRDFFKEAKGRVIFFEKNDIPKKIVKSFPLLGDHNLENLAAAYRLAKIFRINDVIIRKAIKKFRGLPFRQEIIRVLNGITYVNDSTSTTPIATIFAIRRFSNQPIILICGGNSKKLPMGEFIDEVVRKVKSVILLEGTATDEIESRLKAKNQEYKILGRFNDLRKAIWCARGEAKPKDVILFSPAATSFSMFKNEFDRGEQFSKIVKNLK